jgi:two-component system response regulator RegA
MCSARAIGVRTSAPQAAQAPRVQRVLLVSRAPEPAIAQLLRQAAAEVEVVGSDAELATRLEHWKPTCAVLDMDLPEAQGGALALLAAARQARRILLVNADAFFMAIKWFESGRADCVLMKPVHAEELLAAIEPRATCTSLPSLERVQWEYIHAVLGSCHGNVSEAARQLGIFRQSLQRMLRRHPPRH